MKLSTATIYALFWLLPSIMVGQIDSLPKPTIQAERHVEAEITFRKKVLERAIDQEATMSLELVRLRLLIVEEETKWTRFSENSISEMDSLILLRLQSKERQLGQTLALHRSYLEILERTLFWPDREREKVLNEWLEQSKNEDELIGVKAEGLAHHPIGVKVYQQSLPKFDLLAHPPKSDCQLMKNNSGEAGKDSFLFTKHGLLFSHTDQKLESHFPKRDFITGHASLAYAKGGVKILDLMISIASPKANSLFGVIRQRDVVIIKLLDGTEVRLQSQYLVNGDWDVVTQSYIYRCRFLIGIQEERLLKSEEVDKIIVRWSKVQDEFEIFELDFFINHFDCLENG